MRLWKLKFKQSLNHEAQQVNKCAGQHQQMKYHLLANPVKKYHPSVQDDHPRRDEADQIPPGNFQFQRMESA